MAIKLNSKLILKICFDFIILFLIGFPIIYFYCCGIPFKRGFNCEDLSIRYPYHESTISSSFLFIFSAIIPTIVIIATEFTLFTKEHKMRRSKRLVTDLILIIYCNLYNFYFGAFASQTLTDISKYSIGRLRPHFIEVCKPNINCKSDSNINQYITDYECEKEEWSQAQKDLIRDSRLSFMSGHSSFAAYCMVYLAVYLQIRVTNYQFRALRSFIQLLLLYFAIYTGFTRISDYKHHWSDVLCGLLQGTLVALLVIRFLSNNFENKIIDRYTFNQVEDSNVQNLTSVNYNTVNTIKV